MNTAITAAPQHTASAPKARHTRSARFCATISTVTREGGAPKAVRVAVILRAALIVPPRVEFGSLGADGGRPGGRAAGAVVVKSKVLGVPRSCWDGHGRPGKGAREASVLRGPGRGSARCGRPPHADSTLREELPSLSRGRDGRRTLRGRVRAGAGVQDVRRRARAGPLPRLDRRVRQ